MISKDFLIETHRRISPLIHRTPVLTSHTLDEVTGAELYFKCENFQKMGAFKMRGALNAVMLLSDEQKKNGVITHSSGNFAQALALSCRMMNIKAYIVMPSNSPQVKKDAVKGYGGIIIECDSTLIAREEATERIISETHATFIHSYNNENVIAGQGTACKELLEEIPDLGIVIAPVGGGGLISGTALSALYFGKNCRTIGAEPFEVDDAYRSLQKGKIESNVTTNTIADGLKTQLGDKTFAVMRKHVERIIRVTEADIARAMIMILERMKIIVEPSGAAALAAVIREKDFFRGQKTGVILSGGNFDLAELPGIIELIR